MSLDPKLTGIIKDIDLLMADARRPHTVTERILALGTDLLLALAFFALGLTANIVAPQLSQYHATVSALGGLGVLLFWSLARAREKRIESWDNEMRDAKLVALTVDFTIKEVDQRLQRLAESRRQETSG